MTAITPYSVREEKDRIEYGVREEESSEVSRLKQVEDVVLDILSFSGALRTVGKLMIDVDREFDSASVGYIIDHYTGLIEDCHEKIEKILS